MASASKQQQSLYPEVPQSHPDHNTPFHSKPAAATGDSLYPTVDPDELAENFFPEDAAEDDAPAPPTVEETLVAMPRAPQRCSCCRGDGSLCPGYAAYAVPASRMQQGRRRCSLCHSKVRVKKREDGHGYVDLQRIAHK